MNEFWQVFSAVLPVFCLAGLGGLLRRVDWLTVEADKSLLRVVVNVLTPCLIIDNVLDNTSLRRVDNVLFPPLLGFAGICLGLSVAWLFRRFTGIPGGAVGRTFVCAVGHQNYGYAALPLVILLFPRETTGVLFVHNIGVDAAMWSLGLITLGHAGFHEWRRLINIPILAIFGSLLLNAFSAGQWMPDFLRTTIRMLGLSCFPLGIILIGATMADTLSAWRSSGSRSVVWVACGVRCLILPACLLCVAKILPLSIELKRVLAVQAAMPAAAFPIVLARLYGGDVTTAVRVVVATSAVGFVTIPVWIKIGLWWLELDTL
jgi:predicted permease